MDTTTWVIIAIAAGVLVVALGIGFWWAARRRRERAARHEQLRRHFGPEYDAVVDQLGEREAEEELRRRIREYRHDEHQPVGEEASVQVRRRWDRIQYRVLDDPYLAVHDAERLTTEILRERGYAVVDFDERVASLSVDHPELASAYREAYRVHRAGEDGDHDTGAAINALRRYREIIAGLTQAPARSGTPS